MNDDLREQPVIDACLFHEWASIKDLAPYMDEGWAAALDQPFTPISSRRAYVNPLGSKTVLAGSSDVRYDQLGQRLGAASSGTEQLVDFLDRTPELRRIVLSVDDGLLSTAMPSHFVSRAIVSAANDWTTHEWLDRDERVHGLVLISTSLPEAAADEIRRVGSHPKMVGVALGGNGLSRPFGHPVYHPIYEAAAELGLPLVLQIGPETAADALAPAVAGGRLATFSEWSAFSWQANAVHVSSMIVQRVFDLFPGLKVLLVGGGVLWVPGQLWRLDGWYHTNTRESYLRQLPSEYFSTHVRLATYQVETLAQPERLVPALETIPAVADVLMYASCMPNVDAQRPEDVMKLLPAEWHERVLFRNAESFYRWPARAEAAIGASAREESVTRRKDQP
jgi:uncharacterized protein